MKRLSRMLIPVVLALAALVGCKNNEPLAHEKAALEAEWLPFWKGDDCGKLYEQLDPWIAKNAARIKEIDAKWEALPLDERDALVKKLQSEFEAPYRADIQITIMCGLGPIHYRQSEPGK